MTQAAQNIIDALNAYVLQPLASLLFALGLLVFMWGLVEFMAFQHDSSKRVKGSKHMLYGILGLFIMVSIWGIVSLVLSVFGIDCSGLKSSGAITPCQ